jgi:hypothetical protein
MSRHTMARHRRVLWGGGLLMAALALMALPAAAQRWETPAARTLAERAVARRTQQLTDSTLLGYRAKATGYLTFLAQVGDTALLPPKVIKQDQIATEVYWAPPASSKQVVVGLRDTTLLPSDIGYYRDRYGIVQANFPDRIRMGDGKDISDVLHPFAPEGLAAYDFAVTDSLSITTAQGRIDVHRVAFRPREPQQPRAAGAAYLDVATGDIVRLELTFTRAAILDARIEHLAVVLENALIEGRYWLPRAQQIEVQRASTWWQIDVRGIIRGRWEVCCYDVDQRFPVQTFTGPAISFAPPQALRSYAFEGDILSTLPPDVAAVRSEDVERATAMAQELLARSMRERTQRAALTTPAVSELLRYNRVEGVAVGLAGRTRLLGPLWLDARGRYGVGDERAKGEAGLTWTLPQGRSLRVALRDDFTELRDVAEVSGLRNSLAAGLFGTDLSDPMGVRGVGLEATLGRALGARWRVEARVEDQRALTSSQGAGLPPLLAARSGEVRTLALTADGIQRRPFEGLLLASAQLRGFELDGASRGLRLSAQASYTRGPWLLRSTVAAVSGGDIAPQFLALLGGPTTTPGYASYDWAARRAVTQRLERSIDVPFVPVPLGRFGTIPGKATLHPFVHGVWMDGAAGLRGERQGWYPSAGLGLEPFLGMARFDVAYGLRDGRWTFAFDVMRGWWPIL